MTRNSAVNGLYSENCNAIKLPYARGGPGITGRKQPKTPRINKMIPKTISTVSMTSLFAINLKIIAHPGTSCVIN